MIYKPTTYAVESVTSGHPDKICDQIADAILDECLKQDASSRVAIEAFGSHGIIIVGGEVTTKSWVDVPAVVNGVLKDIGYDDHYGVISNIVGQSPDIAMGVDAGGAGDQGIMYGYAIDETPEYLPLGVVLAHKLSRGLEELRKSRQLLWLKPDGKSEVIISNGRATIVLVSCQHEESIEHADMQKDITKNLIAPVVGDLSQVEILLNPTGKFVRGGFDADTGLTGRKIMVDTYGGLIPHGGGCFSGKDPTKVDRSAAYMARFAAKNVVANGLAKECLVSVAYAIGRAEPLMLEAVNETGGNITNVVAKNFDFRPQAIIERLDLRRPIYQQTAAYGHFGRANLPWEEIISLS
ncbi:methionine adenosyltransferase [Candidatus Uhrbacteria bacterium RIFCSPLOWO2_02_FULL_48_12]|uniref:Methionine adenosyltransferase n=1 Tax=Candidatus Uhrbacteria bacterium RIFCSPLOWO2_02_FULL_48_12 TaxID=1802407 RepID=A0A1F7V7U6_9BACT|nr:MAG: methionine adenosyltransferase [Candidatus Uhrbacteria bacterium RIFCSPLOWO2_02_FULL_48_12]